MPISDVVVNIRTKVDNLRDISDFKEEVRDLKREKEDLRDSMDDVTDAMDDLTESISSNRGGAGGAMDNVARKMEKVSTTATDLEDNLEETGDTVQALSQTLAKTSNDADDLQRALTNNDYESDDLKSLVRELDRLDDDSFEAIIEGLSNVGDSTDDLDNASTDLFDQIKADANETTQSLERMKATMDGIKQELPDADNAARQNAPVQEVAEKLGRKFSFNPPGEDEVFKESFAPAVPLDNDTLVLESSDTTEALLQQLQNVPGIDTTADAMKQMQENPRDLARQMDVPIDFGEFAKGLSPDERDPEKLPVASNLFDSVPDEDAAIDNPETLGQLQGELGERDQRFPASRGNVVSLERILGADDDELTRVTGITDADEFRQDILKDARNFLQSEDVRIQEVLIDQLQDAASDLGQASQKAIDLSDASGENIEELGQKVATRVVEDNLEALTARTSSEFDNPERVLDEVKNSILPRFSGGSPVDSMGELKPIFDEREDLTQATSDIDGGPRELFGQRIREVFKRLNLRRVRDGEFDTMEAFLGDLNERNVLDDAITDEFRQMAALNADIDTDEDKERVENRLRSATSLAGPVKKAIKDIAFNDHVEGDDMVDLFTQRPFADETTTNADGRTRTLTFSEDMRARITGVPDGDLDGFKADRVEELKPRVEQLTKLMRDFPEFAELAAQAEDFPTFTGMIKEMDATDLEEVGEFLDENEEILEEFFESVDTFGDAFDASVPDDSARKVIKDSLGGSDITGKAKNNINGFTRSILRGILTDISDVDDDTGVRLETGEVPREVFRARLFDQITRAESKGELRELQKLFTMFEAGELGFDQSLAQSSRFQARRAKPLVNKLQRAGIDESFDGNVPRLARGLLDQVATQAAGDETNANDLRDLLDNFPEELSKIVTDFVEATDGLDSSDEVARALEKALREGREAAIAAVAPGMKEAMDDAGIDIADMQVDPEDEFGARQQLEQQSDRINRSRRGSVLKGGAPDGKLNRFLSDIVGLERGAGVGALRDATESVAGTFGKDLSEERFRKMRSGLFSLRDGFASLAPALGATSLNLGPLSVGLQNMTRRVFDLIALLGPFVTVVGSLATTTVAATGALAGFVAVGAVGFLDDMANSMAGVEDRGEALEKLFEALQQASLERLSVLQNAQIGGDGLSSSEAFVAVLRGALDMLEQFAEISASIVEMDAFQAFVEDISAALFSNDGGDTLMTELQKSMEAVLPLVSDILVAIINGLPLIIQFMTEITQQMGTELASAFAEFAQILPTIVFFGAKFVEVLLKLAVAVFGVISAIREIPIFGDILVTLIGAVFALAGGVAVLSIAFATLVTTIGITITTLVDWKAAVMATTTVTKIQTYSTLALSKAKAFLIGTLYAGIKAYVLEAMSKLRSVGATILDTASTLADAAAKLALGVATGIASAAMAVFSALTSTTALTLFALAAAVLVAVGGLYLLAKAVGDIMESMGGLEGMIEGVKQTLVDLGNAFQTGIFQGMNSDIEMLNQTIDRLGESFDRTYQSFLQFSNIPAELARQYGPLVTGQRSATGRQTVAQQRQTRQQSQPGAGSAAGVGTLVVNNYGAIGQSDITEMIQEEIARMINKESGFAVNR